MYQNIDLTIRNKISRGVYQDVKKCLKDFILFKIRNKAVSY